MNTIYLPIDIKSLYMNIKNDNLSGHTATVATPLKQGNSYNEDLGQLLTIKENEIYFENRQGLLRELIKKSKSKILITNVFVFNKISVNGKMLNNKKQFCIFIKKEIDPDKVQYGRLKVHYPMTLKYEDDNDLSIDNKDIMNSVSKKLHDYAFIVTGFEYNKLTHILNFNAFVVGENQTPYSKVFINEKGVGNKFTAIFNESADDYDMEIISLRRKFGESVNTYSFSKFSQKNQEKANEIIEKHLKNQGFNKIKLISKQYPYSLCDIIYNDHGVIKYGLVYNTSTSLKYLNLSRARLAFCSEFNEDVTIFLITNILDQPIINTFFIGDLDRFSKNINSVKFIQGDNEK